MEDRTKFSYVAAQGIVKVVTTNLKKGDYVKVKLSGAIIKVDEVFTLNHDKYWRNTPGLHIRGIVAHDGDYFNSDRGERSNSIPFDNIEGVVDIEKIKCNNIELPTV